MGHRVDRKASGPAGRVVTKAQCGKCVAELMKRKRDHERGQNYGKKQPLALIHEGDHGSVGALTAQIEPKAACKTLHESREICKVPFVWHM